MAIIKHAIIKTTTNVKYAQGRLMEMSNRI